MDPNVVCDWVNQSELFRIFGKGVHTLGLLLHCLQGTAHRGFNMNIAGASLDHAQACPVADFAGEGAAQPHFPFCRADLSVAHSVPLHCQ